MKRSLLVFSAAALVADAISPRAGVDPYRTLLRYILRPGREPDSLFHARYLVCRLI
jgi:hypothetical protein